MATAAVLIDLDGTLWDSAPWVAKLLADGDSAECRRIARRLRDPGGGARSAVLLKERFTPAAFARACFEYGDSLPCYPGALDTLAAIHARLAVGVVTSLPAWMAQPMMAAVGVDSLMAVVQCAQWGVPAKPSPAGLRRALSALAVAPIAVTYVGDCQVDQQAARAAGTNFAWASWGYDTSVEAERKLQSWADLRAHA